MEVKMSPTFDEQRRRYAFCFTCESCAHFDTDTGQCIHGFPNEMHKLTYYTTSPPPETILFCKDFDLG